jgi:hypothetical protein
MGHPVINGCEEGIWCNPDCPDSGKQDEQLIMQWAFAWEAEHK